MPAIPLENQWITKVTRDPETNSKFAPENGWLEDDPASFWVSAHFQGRLLLVLGRLILGSLQEDEEIL